MAGGSISLGGATFTLTGNNQQLLQALTQATAATQQSTQAMAAAQKLYAQAALQTNQSIKVAYLQAAQQMQATAAVHAGTSKQIIAGLQQQQNALKQTGAAVSSYAKDLKGLGGTLATLTGFGAIASGALVVRESLLAVTDATLKAEQAQRSLQASYGQAAPAFTQYANQLSDALGRPATEIQQGVAAFGILQKQYGFTSTEIKNLTKVALDLNAAYGGDLLQTFKDVSNAMQGEPQALEKYGIALQQNAILNSRLLTDEQRKLYEGMTATSQARIRLTVLMDGAKDVEGQAQKRAADLAGSLDRVQKAWQSLAITVGQQFGPGIKVASDALTVLLDKLNEIVRVMGTFFTIGQQLGSQAGLPPWLSTLLSPVLAAAVPILAIFNGELAKTVNAGVAGAAALSAETIAAQELAGNLKAIRDQQIGEARDRQKQLADLEKEAQKAAIDAENDAYEAKRAAYQADKEAQLAAVAAKKQAALDGIKAEKEAAEDAYTTKKALLEKERDAALQAAEDRHKAATQALDAESDAVHDAADLQVRAINQTADAAREAADERERLALRALEMEERARDEFRTREDRALQDETERVKRAIEDRHTAATRALDDEAREHEASIADRERDLDKAAKKADDRHKKQLRDIEQRKKAADAAAKAQLDAIEAEGKAADKAHKALADALDAEKQAAEDRHDTVMDGLEAELDAATAAHDAAIDRIDAERDAARDGHDALIDGLNAELKAAKDLHTAESRRIKDAVDGAERRHDVIVRTIEEELRAAKDRHDLEVRGIEDGVKAAERAHDARLRAIDAEGDAAERLHDDQLRAIDDLKDAEDDRHKARLAAIDEEQRRQEAYLEGQLGLLDEEERKEAGANRLAGLQTDLEEALSSGDQGEILAAQKAILEEQNKQTRDALRAQLEARRDAVKAATDLAKDQAAREHDQAQQAIADAKEIADARLKATKDALDAAKQAANDEYALIKDTADARKQALDDALDAVQREADTRKRAADDELARIKTESDARQQALDDELARVEASIGARKQQADSALEQIQKELDARKKQADDQLQLIRTDVDARKDAADKALDQVKRDVDARKDAADKELARIKEVLDARKQAIADAKTARDADLEDEKTKADEALEKAKGRIDARKLALKEESDDFKAKMDARRRQEHDDRETEQREAEDQTTHARRQIADRRTAEDLAAKDKRYEIGETHRIETEAINDARDVALQASKDALSQYDNDMKARRLVVDQEYDHEKDKIKETYDDPVTGLLPKLKKAYDDTKAWYDKRTVEVDRQYDNEKKAIEATFDHPQTGLFAKLKKVHDETIDGLKDTKKDWEDNFQKPIEEVTKKTFENVQSSFDALLGHIKGSTAKPGGGGDDGDKKGGGGDGGGGGGGGAPPRKSGNQYRPIVENASGNIAWTDQGTHAGGPAVDIFAPKGSAIRAPTGGRMESATYPKGGNAGWLYGQDGRVYYFAHANSRMKDGTVEPGEKIGEVGTTGNAEGTSPHLHFAIGSSDSGITGNGSGDIWGDSSYWEGGAGEAPGDDQQLAPGVRVKDGYLVFTLFGREFRLKLPNVALRGSALIQAIQQLGKSIGGDEFGRVAAAVAASETENGQYLEQINGPGRGPFQFDPGGELKNYAKALGVSLDEAGQLAVTQPMAAARWALEGYLGDAIKEGQKKEGLSGADLADYASRVGQRPAGENWRRAGDFYRKLYGYRDGGYIPEPTLLVGKTLGPYAMAGEVAPEWVTPNAPGGGNGPLQRAEFPIHLGNREVERIWIDGYHLNVRRGRTFSGTSAR